MLELAELFMHIAYDVQALEMTRLRVRPAPRRMSIQSANDGQHVVAVASFNP
jgi:hypothetical protein